MAMSASRGDIEQPSGDVAAHGAPQGMVGSSTGSAVQQPQLARATQGMAGSSTGSAVQQPQLASNEGFMNQPRALIEWRSQGWLSNDEFNAAKRQLGL